MARKRYSDEDVLKLLREIDVHLHDGLDVLSACRITGIQLLVIRMHKSSKQEQKLLKRLEQNSAMKK